MRTLYPTMRSTSTKDSRSIPAIDLTTEQLRERLRPIAEKAKENAWAKNSYAAYYDKALCPDPTYAIHEYRDRKELVKLENGKAHLIKIL
ncbi:MAG: hypothetical protein ACXVB0_03480 [Mucilaginibacter sp.]